MSPITARITTPLLLNKKAIVKKYMHWRQKINEKQTKNNKIRSRFRAGVNLFHWISHSSRFFFYPSLYRKKVLWLQIRFVYQEIMKENEASIYEPTRRLILIAYASKWNHSLWNHLFSDITTCFLFALLDSAVIEICGLELKIGGLIMQIARMEISSQLHFLLFFENGQTNTSV